MARVPIPHTVYLKSVEEGRKAKNHGAGQMRFLKEYLKVELDKDAELEIKGFERTNDETLYAVVDKFVPDPAEIPAKFRKKPKR